MSTSTVRANRECQTTQPQSKAEFFRHRIANDDDHDVVAPLISELLADRRRRKLMKQALPFYLAQRGYSSKAKEVFNFTWALAEDESARLDNGHLKAHYTVQYRYYRKTVPMQNKPLNESERRTVREQLNLVEAEQDRIGGWLDLEIIRGSKPNGSNQATEFIPHFIVHLRAIAEIAEANPRMGRSSRHAVEYAVRKYLERGPQTEIKHKRDKSSLPFKQKDAIAQARGMNLRVVQLLIEGGLSKEAIHRKLSHEVVGPALALINPLPDIDTADMRTGSACAGNHGLIAADMNLTPRENMDITTPPPLPMNAIKPISLMHVTHDSAAGRPTKSDTPSGGQVVESPILSLLQPRIFRHPFGAAREMLKAFIAVGCSRFRLHVVEQFGMTRDEVNVKRAFPSQTPKQKREGVPPPPLLSIEKTEKLLRSQFAHCEQMICEGANYNLVIRPYAGDSVNLVQLDDLDREGAARVAPYSFLTIETSPGNFQAWLAVKDELDAGRVERLRLGTNCDREASGFVRVAGSQNAHPKRKSEKGFPRVEIMYLNVKRLPDWAELEDSGLMSPAASKVFSNSPAKTNKQGKNSLHLPTARSTSFDALYEESYKNARPTKTGDPNRSVVDFDVACRTLRANYLDGKNLTDSCAFLYENLLRRAPKAKDKGAGYVSLTINKALAEQVALRERKNDQVAAQAFFKELSLRVGEPKAREFIAKQHAKIEARNNL